MEIKIFANMALGGLVLIFGLLAPSCETNPPLDADSRQQVDSITFAQTRVLRREMDSLCKEERLVRLPQLIDSIKRERLREIQEQLKSVKQ